MVNNSFISFCLTDLYFGLTPANTRLTEAGAHKQSSLLFLLAQLFEKQGIHLLVDEKKRKITAYDSTTLDVRQISQKIARTLKETSRKTNWPLFYFDNQTLCCELSPLSAEVLQVEIPSIAEWTSMLHSPPHPIFSHCPSLILPLGISISLQEFVEHPLFKNTLEKYSVFSFLTSFIQNSEFHKKYSAFLDHIKQEYWFEPYLSDPKGLANLSLIAFLEDKIPQEDLFVIHMVASALGESSKAHSVKITVLEENSARLYLTSAHYPPFDISCFFTTKTPDELNQAQQMILIRIKDKSPIQRTAIAYTISSKETTARSSKPIEEFIFYNLDYPLGYSNTAFFKKDLNSVVILPLSFCLELYKAASSLQEPPPSNHTCMFGFNDGPESLEALEKGRPVSIASPLFTVPYVHGSLTGKQLGITVHDILYHLAIDWQNPHCALFIHLGRTILKQTNNTEGLNKIGVALLDREFNGYRGTSQENTTPIHTFFESLSFLVAYKKTPPSDQKSFALILKSTLPSKFWNLKVIRHVAALYKFDEQKPLNSEDNLIDFNRFLFLTKLLDL